MDIRRRHLVLLAVGLLAIWWAAPGLDPWSYRVGTPRWIFVAVGAGLLAWWAGSWKLMRRGGAARWVGWGVLLGPVVAGGLAIFTVGGLYLGMDARMAPQVSLSAESPIGFSVGGAKDIGNFRENLRQGFLPVPTDLTTEGLFYDYFFDTGQTDPCRALFCPAYSAAVSIHPLTGETGHHLSVGLTSGITDFERKRLRLVVVLDISGSMSSSMLEYHYDGDGTPPGSLRKMRVANESVAALLEHLAPDDELGIVLFDDSAYKAMSLRRVGSTDIEAIQGHVLELEPQGGTDMEAGYGLGTRLLGNPSSDPEVEDRILFLTDAMPNRGVQDPEGLLSLTRSNALEGIHTTFIGIGVDFNTELVEAITKTRGANYYAVHDAETFGRRLDEEFDYLVTPLVFDLELTLEAEGYAIGQVHGSPEADEATGRILYVRTLFPSATEEGETRGGVVLLELDRLDDDARLDLRVSYEDRDGERHESAMEIVFDDRIGFDNTGIRKAVLLSRYAELLRGWMEVEHRRLESPKDPELGSQERTSVALVVSDDQREDLATFREHLVRELDELGDEALSREEEVLDTLLATGT